VLVEYVVYSELIGGEGKYICRVVKRAQFWRCHVAGTLSEDSRNWIKNKLGNLVGALDYEDRLLWEPADSAY